MNDKDTLKQRVGEICDLMLNDVKAFQYLKSQHAESYKEANEDSKLGIGGGNFLQTLGTLSVFYFLVKMNHMVRFESLDKLNEALGDFKKYSMRIEKAGCRVEDLYKLAGVNWYIKYEDLYRNYRNYLAHVSVPKGVINADIAFLSGNDYVNSCKTLERSNAHVFEVDDSGSIISLNADLLFRDVQRMKKALINKIGNIENRDEELTVVLQIINEIFT